MSKIKVGIAGGSGYTGLELLRILNLHPLVEVVWISSESFAGKSLEQYCPAWIKRMSLEFLSLGKQGIPSPVDAVFLALPHGESMGYLKFFDSKVKVIDLSADFRFRSKETYERVYGVTHLEPLVLEEAVYGIPEIYGNEIAQARLVANPGCYPTSVIIPVYPLLREGLVEENIIVDSKSGVSGAGKKPKESTHFCEVYESFKAYGVGGHRHQPEMEERLSELCEKEVKVIFVPHLLPVKRGILSTIYLKLRREVSEQYIFELFETYYQNRYWVRVFPPGNFPEIKWVVGSNFIDIGFLKVGHQLILISAIDNLTKGASGQAVQNMNIMFGIDEKVGLPESTLYP
ncbi:MAG: N-acetyl-gamma-glutamyl-phosphate reductase [Candidatus Atribacteria bacterium]|nr:N-acetyl-gamma-glutamyl-phosphate reductase [Candidatus Atribacteria bacterium]MCD6350436.1 N-acetyl-gamma-glutamyl-phosphate reductase [Candidatus Atribacteria bacterium]